MKRFEWVCLTGLLVLLVGCKTMHQEGLASPTAASYSESYQQSLQASAHWRTVALDISQQVKHTLARRGMESRRLYVQVPAGRSDFNRAFHDFILSSMLGHGLQISSEPKGSLPISYDVQLIEYKPGRKGLITDAQAQSRQLAEVPNMEVIVSAAIVDANQYLMHETSIYYINERDSRLYEAVIPAVLPAPLQGRKLSVKGCRPGVKEC